MHGRYPDYDVMAQSGHWDEATRRVVVDRVANPPPIRFFTAAESATLEALCDAVTAQDAEPRIPVLRYVDERFHERKFLGFRYADMPPDDEAWRLVAQGLDEAAATLGHESFADVAEADRLEICVRFSHGDLRGGVWKRLPVERAWKVVTRDIVAAFYAHPWAWNEIGFGGPAYPRGYARIGPGGREEWEGAEAFELDPVADVRARGIDL
jgi:hypothetical protein